ncbi:MAG: hypothetical protein AAF865_15450 [Pseudomonadota bacterium]
MPELVIGAAVEHGQEESIPRLKRPVTHCAKKGSQANLDQRLA